MSTVSDFSLNQPSIIRGPIARPPISALRFTHRTSVSRIRGNHGEHRGHGEVTEKERKKRPANVVF
ncbi:MAG: hypothetical protein D6679_00835 [Candidatus Hydrogenedentota bacterium]|nr:MAG: hypothetical protein D6679_00835 [Candidatus Hydrogenedentota bacterium]